LTTTCELLDMDMGNVVDGEEEVELNRWRLELQRTEAVLAHVPHHPLLALQRYRVSELEAEWGDTSAALALIEQSVAVLSITHGDGHPLCRDATAWREEMRALREE
jgi:hypothetical protein